MTSGVAGSEERLWRREDPEVFGATVLTAAEQLDVQPLAVQKDYWVCQALRAVITAFPEQIIFKGGTSLEKLRLIQRFSEDLDLLVVTDFPNERQGRKRLKEMCQVAARALESEPAGEKSGGNLNTWLMPLPEGLTSWAGLLGTDRQDGVQRDYLVVSADLDDHRAARYSG